MKIIIDESAADFALQFVFTRKDPDEVNFICNRIMEAVPGMQFSIVVQLQQRIDDYFKNNDPDYLLASPIRRLMDILKSKRAEFVE
jgi:hypothetical protein